MYGQGCPECVNRIQKYTTKEFIQKVIQTHPDKHYIFDKTIYTGHNDKVIITCPIHGDFEVHACNFINTSRNSDCPTCSRERLSCMTTSKKEKEIVEFLKNQISDDNKFTIIENDYNILKNINQELDIYIPEKKLAIEFDGIYWHSEVFKADNYHIQKTIECEKQGIQLIHIFENEWVEKRSIVESRLKQIIGNTYYSIPARKCIIKPLTYEQEKSFMNTNHLQGFISSTICYGLFYTEKKTNKEYLVAAMSFGSLRKNLGSDYKSGIYELYRFCNLKNFHIIGGASKLFKHFIKTYNPKKVISYANRRYSSNIKNNILYDKLGFKFDSFSQPSYFYIIDNKLINRFAMRKDILISKYGCSPEKSEHEFCLDNEWYRIYDCGNLKYVWNSI